MSATYLAKARSAYATIAKKGTTVTVVRTTAPTYDALTDTESGGGETEFNTVGVILPPTTQTEQTYAEQFQSGSLVRSDVRKVLLAALKTGTLEPFNISEEDTLKFAGHEWSILGWNSLNPDEDIAIMHDLAVSR